VPDERWRYRIANLNREVAIKLLREFIENLEKGRDEPLHQG
jgi:hypothetical protein